MIKLLEDTFDNIDNQSVQRGLFNNAVSNNPIKFDSETSNIWSRMSIENGDCLVIIGYKN